VGIGAVVCGDGLVNRTGGGNFQVRPGTLPVILGSSDGARVGRRHSHGVVHEHDAADERPHGEKPQHSSRHQISHRRKAYPGLHDRPGTRPVLHQTTMPGRREYVGTDAKFLGLRIIKPVT